MSAEGLGSLRLSNGVSIPESELVKWDHRVDYDSTVERLASDILKERDLASRSAIAQALPNIGDLDNEARIDLDEEAPVRLGWFEVYLIQIVGGCRAIEGFDAWQTWVKTGARSMRVRVRKTVLHCKTCSHIKTSKSETNGHSLTGVKGERGKCKNKGCVCTKFIPDMENAKTRLLVIPQECLDSDRDLFIKILETRTLNGYKKFARRHIANTHSARYSLINKMKRDGASTSTISKTTGQTEKQVEGYLDEVEAERLLMERANAPRMKSK
jgi:hypothetical protein